MTDDNALYIVGTIFVVLIAVFFWARKRAKAHQLKQGSGTAIGPLSVEGNGGPFVYSYQPPKFHKGREIEPPYLEVQLLSPSAHAFYLWERRTMAGPQISLGFCPALTVSPSFDRDFVYAASDWSAVSLMLKDSRSQAAWKKLTELGFTQLEHDGTHFTARRTPYRDETDPAQLPFLQTAAEQLREWGSHLSSLRGANSSLGGYVDGMKRLNWPGLHWLLPLLMVLGGVFAGFAYGNFPTLTWRPFTDYLLGISAAIYVGLVFVLRQLCQRYLVRTRVLTTVLLCSFIFVVAAVWGGLAWVNGALDEHTSVVQRSPVLEAYSGRGRRRDTYKVVAQSFQDPNDTFTIEVSHRLFERARYPGAMLELELKPGRLGFAWIVRKDIIVEGQP